MANIERVILPSEPDRRSDIRAPEPPGRKRNLFWVGLICFVVLLLATAVAYLSGSDVFFQLLGTTIVASIAIASWFVAEQGGARLYEEFSALWTWFVTHPRTCYFGALVLLGPLLGFLSSVMGPFEIDFPDGYDYGIRVGLVSAMGLLPAFLVFGWTPASTIPDVLVFSLISALLHAAAAWARDELDTEPYEILTQRGATLLIHAVAAMVGLAIVQWAAPELLLGFGGDSRLARLPPVAFAAALLFINLRLWWRIDELQDYSGAYETATSAYWADLSGKFYMNATKLQAGEWEAPMGSSWKLLLVNVGCLGATLGVWSLRPTLSFWPYLAWGYLGLLFGACAIAYWMEDTDGRSYPRTFFGG